MRITWLSTLFALVFGIASAVSAAELRDVVVESVDEEAGTITLTGITYHAGEDVSLVGLVPGQQVNIEYEENDDGQQVLNRIVPAN